MIRVDTPLIRRLLAGSAALALAAAPVAAQTVADSARNALPQAGLDIKGFAGSPGLAYFDPFAQGWKSVPIAEPELPHNLANPFTFLGGTVQPTLDMRTGSATIAYTPFANNLPLYTSGLIASTVRQTATREFTFSIDQKAMIGDSSITTGQDGAVAFYVDQECGGTNQRCWAGNFVSRIDPDWNGKQYNGPEVNLNTNGSLDMSGSVADPSGLPQTSWGIPITGVSYGAGNKGKFTGGVVLGSDGTSPFGEGFAVLPGTVRNVAFADWGGSKVGFLAAGIHTYGFSAVGLIGTPVAMTGGPNFEAANGNGYFARNAANTADLQLIGIDNKNNVVIAGGAAGSTIFGSGYVLPAGDSGSALGNANNRFNGTWTNLLYLSPGYTKANLPGGQPAGSMTWCTNCRKPGQAAGQGNGMPVSFDGGAWIDTTGNAAQS